MDSLNYAFVCADLFLVHKRGNEYSEFGSQLGLQMLEQNEQNKGGSFYVFYI